MRRIFGSPLILARQVYRLLIRALIACTDLPGWPGDLAWRIVAVLFERAMRDRED